MSYTHPEDPNLRNLHKSMEYDIAGNPAIRTIGTNLTNTNPGMVAYADSASLTSFGRVRNAEARLLGEYRYMYGSGTTVEMNDLVTSGASITVDYARVCALGNVGTTAGQRVVRQTKQYHPYIAGTSNIGAMTFTMNAAKAGLVQAVGMFDDQNGIFLRQNGLTTEVVIRKQGVDTEVVTQSNWNVDTFDGTGSLANQSGYSLDMSKSQILVIDYQWLGVGRVRIGFVRDGVTHYVHYFTHANEVTEVYMTQPSLPCRWEIYNASNTVSASQLMMICASVYCEGASAETGFMRAVSTDGTTTTVTNTTDGQCILAIRLKNTVVGKQNHAMARLKDWSVYATNDCQYRVVIFNDASKLNGGTTWQPVPGYGWCEYTKNTTMVAGWLSGNDFNVIVDSFASGAVGVGSGQSATTSLESRTNTIFQNYDSTSSQVLAIIATKLSNNADVRAGMTWIEIK